MGRPSSWKTKTTWPPLGFCERYPYICFLSFFIMKTKIFKFKDGLVRHINSLDAETEELTDTILHLGFNWGFHMNKTVTHGSNICGTVSSSSWNGLHHWVVDLVLFVCRSVCYHHRWNLIWTYVPNYYLSTHWRVGDFSRPSSAHSELVHISDSVFCKETPASLRKLCNNFAYYDGLYISTLAKFSIFMAVMMVYKSHILRILQYFCL